MHTVLVNIKRCSVHLSPTPALRPRSSSLGQPFSKDKKTRQVIDLAGFL